jgi:hypothetical protein
VQLRAAESAVAVRCYAAPPPRMILGWCSLGRSLLLSLPKLFLGVPAASIVSLLTKVEVRFTLRLAVYRQAP